MKNKKLSIILFLSVFLFTACSGGVEKDAEKASSLALESMRLTREGRLNEAEIKYMEAQHIMDKYKEHEQAKEFYEMYSAFLQETKN